MTSLPLDGWIVCWTPVDSLHWTHEAPGEIIVAALGDNVYWDHRYAFTGGCCYSERHSMSKEMQIAMMFIDFHTCIVRDGINPKDAHREFLKIAEYRRRISADIPGANN